MIVRTLITKKSLNKTSSGAVLDLDAFGRSLKMMDRRPVMDGGGAVNEFTGPDQLKCRRGGKDSVVTAWADRCWFSLDRVLSWCCIEDGCDFGFCAPVFSGFVSVHDFSVLLNLRELISACALEY